MRHNALKARWRSLKRPIVALGFVRPGSLVRRFMPCGKPSCRCMAEQRPRLHGPYYQWTCKEGGKTRTIRLSKEQARACKEWTKNHRRLRTIVHRMERFSLKETDRLLGGISRR